MLEGLVVMIWGSMLPFVVACRQCGQPKQHSHNALKAAIQMFPAV